MNIARKYAGVLSPLLLLIASSTALADSATNVSSGLTLKGAPLAAHGYDVVAYFTQGEPIIGEAKFSAVYADSTYRFANAKHLALFEKNPEKYVPQFGGFCAYGVSVGAKFDGDPRMWRIVNGKLYFNLNAQIKQTWEKDIPGNIKKARANWRKIEHQTPESLS